MNWIPTQKWIASTVVGAIGLAVMLLTGDRAHVADAEIVAIGTFLVQRVTAWAVPNSASDNARGLAHSRNVSDH